MLRKNLMYGITLASVATTTAVHGATLYWDGSGTNWQTVSNWSTDLAGTTDPAAIPGSADDVIFGASTVTTNQSFTTNAAQRANSLSFTDTTGLTYLLASSNSTARLLTIGSGGVTVAAGSGAVTLGSSSATISVRVGASQTWTNNSANTLNIRNNAAGDSTVLTPITWTFNTAGAGNISDSGALSDGGAPLSIVVASTGAGLVSIAAGNHTGGTTIKSGRLQFNGNAGTGNILIGDTTGSADASLLFGGAATVGANITVHSGNTGAMALTSSFDLAFNGTVTLDKALTATVNGSSKTFTFNNAIGGSGLLTKAGTQTIDLRGSNTHTGNIFIDAGSLRLTNIATNGTSTGSLLFNIQDSSSNKVYGDATNAVAFFDGTFKLDLSAVSVESGTWNLVDTATLNETFGDNFSVVDSSGTLTFSQSANVWTSSNGRWIFSESNGSLELLVPEPASLSLLAMGSGLLLGRRRHRR